MEKVFVIVLTSGVNEYFYSISIQFLVPTLTMIKVNIIEEEFPQPFMNSRITFLDLVFFWITTYLYILSDYENAYTEEYLISHHPLNIVCHLGELDFYLNGLLNC